MRLILLLSLVLLSGCMTTATRYNQTAQVPIEQVIAELKVGVQKARTNKPLIVNDPNQLIGAVWKLENSASELRYNYGSSAKVNEAENLLKELHTILFPKLRQRWVELNAGMFSAYGNDSERMVISTENILYESEVIRLTRGLQLAFCELRFKALEFQQKSTGRKYASFYLNTSEDWDMQDTNDSTTCAFRTS